MIAASPSRQSSSAAVTAAAAASPASSTTTPRGPGKKLTDFIASSSSAGSRRTSVAGPRRSAGRAGAGRALRNSPAPRAGQVSLPVPGGDLQTGDDLVGQDHHQPPIRILRRRQGRDGRAGGGIGGEAVHLARRDDGAG